METASPEVERFWSNVDKSGGPDACWPWQLATKQPFGHGAVKIRGKVKIAHRVAYEFATGQSAEGCVIRHYVCDNPRCCNPAHLKPGTHADNVADRVAKGRSAIGVRSGRAKLNPESVAKIWGLLQSGASAKDIAKIFSVDRRAISFIRDRKNWRSVTDGLPPLSPRSPHGPLSDLP